MDANAKRAGVDLEVLERVLCGVDGSPAGTEAVRQGARLRAPEGTIVLASVATAAAAAHAAVTLALDARAAVALRVRSLLDDPARAEAIGREAKERVRHRFLGTRTLIQSIELYERHISRQAQERAGA